MSHEPLDKATTIRQPSVALLCVNSSDQETYDPATGLRINSSTPARIYINNQQPALFGYMTRLALTEVSMEWDIPNVNDYNNTLTIGYYDVATPTVLAGVVRITLPVGFYTAPQLGIAVKDALNANATLTAQFGANTFLIQYGVMICGTNPLVAGQTLTARGSQFAIQTTSATARFAILPYSKKYTGLPVLQDDLTNMMGLTPSQTTLTSYKTFIGGYASLQYTPYVDIVSNILTKNQNIRDGTSSKTQKTSSILARIYLSNENFTPREVTITYAPTTGVVTSATDNAIGTKPGTLRREFAYPKQISWNNTENVDVIDLEVLDAKGNPLFFQPTASTYDPNTIVINNTADFFFTLQATEN